MHMAASAYAVLVMSMTNKEVSTVMLPIPNAPHVSVQGTPHIKSNNFCGRILGPIVAVQSPGTLC